MASSNPSAATNSDPLAWAEVDDPPIAEGISSTEKAQLLAWIEQNVAPSRRAEVGEAMHQAWSSRDSGTRTSWISSLTGAGQSYVTGHGISAPLPSQLNSGASAVKQSASSNPFSGGIAAGAASVGGSLYSVPRPPTSVSPTDPSSLGLVPQTEWDEMSTALGYDAKAAFSAYSNQFHATVNANGPRHQAGEDPPAGRSLSPGTAPNAQGWIAQQKQAVYGPYAAVLDYYAQQYALQTGVAMPAELWHQMAAALNTMPWSTQQQLNADMTALNDPRASSSAYSQARSDLLNNSQLNTMYNAYTTAHPTATAQAQQALTRLDGQMFSALGRHATEADIKAIGQNATDEQIRAYIDARPSGVISGMNYGTYNASKSRADTYWMKYYGKQAAASDVARTAGMSDTELQDFVFNSPSKVTGINIGRYNALDTEASKITQDLWGTGATTELIDHLHKAIKG